MRIGSLFSGIGGLELGLERSGLGHTVWQVEKDEYCRQILARHWPNAHRAERCEHVGARNLQPVDLICGGFPCQDISSAGKGAGLAGKRSRLWFAFARVVSEMRPRWVVVENVASGAKRWVDAVCTSLGQLGYETLPIPLSAQDVGAPHLRRRVFVIAYSNRGTLREQPRGRSGPSWQKALLPTSDGPERAPCHPDRDGESAQPVDAQVARLSGMAGDSPPWAFAPEFCGMDDGIPHRVERLRALGNAVVPQCAEVIGHVILELERSVTGKS